MTEFNAQEFHTNLKGKWADFTRQAESVLEDLRVAYEHAIWTDIKDVDGKPYVSWEAYCAAEFPAPLKLTAAQRGPLVALLKEPFEDGAVMSNVAVGTVLGVSEYTVRKDSTSIKNEVDSPPKPPIRGRDQKTRKPPKKSEPKKSKKELRIEDIVEKWGKAIAAGKKAYATLDRLRHRLADDHGVSVDQITKDLRDQGFDPYPERETYEQKVAREAAEKPIVIVEANDVAIGEITKGFDHILTGRINTEDVATLAHNVREALARGDEEWLKRSEANVKELRGRVSAWFDRVENLFYSEEARWVEAERRMHRPHSHEDWLASSEAKSE